jgi:hypothetical protein
MAIEPQINRNLQFHHITKLPQHQTTTLLRARIVGFLIRFRCFLIFGL